MHFLSPSFFFFLSFFSALFCFLFCFVLLFPFRFDGRLVHSLFIYPSRGVHLASRPFSMTSLSLSLSLSLPPRFFPFFLTSAVKVVSSSLNSRFN